MPAALRILWLQGITCNGNSHSFLNHPDIERFLQHFTMLHHPSLPCRFTLNEIMTNRSECDILIIEGALQPGFLRHGVELTELLRDYAARSSHIIAAGTCASFGGIHREIDPSTISGLLYRGEERDGPLAKHEDKVINLPGCPIHPEWLGHTLSAIRQSGSIATDTMNRPSTLYTHLVHNGCLRNEYFEWKVDARQFGTKEGCLYYEQGCQAPYTHGSCNKILWNGVSSKTRAGTPCLGCTEPTFPKRGLFETATNMSIPATLPDGVPKRAYLTLTGVAKSFHIKRLESPLFPPKESS